MRSSADSDPRPSFTAEKAVCKIEKSLKSFCFYRVFHTFALLFNHEILGTEDDKENSHYTMGIPCVDGACVRRCLFCHSQGLDRLYASGGRFGES